MEKKLPKGWVEVELRFLGDYINGRAFKPNEWKNSGLPIVRIQNLNDPFAPFNFSDTEHEPKYLIRRGELLMAWSASLGVYIWEKENAWLNQHIFKVIENNKIVTKKFLFYTLQVSISDFYKKTHGSGMVHITKPVFEAHKVSLPPLPEQQRIVAKLDTLFGQLDRIKASMERIPQLLKDFRQKVLTQAVTGKLTEEWREGRELEEWEMKTLEEFVIKIQAGKNFNCPEYPVTEDTVGLVKISAVTWGKFDPNETKTVLDKSKIFPELFIKKGDFLITRANTLELVGACLIVDEVKYKIMLSDKVWRVTFKDDIDQRFVDVFLKSSLGRAEIESRATGNQLSMRNISQDSFRKIDFNYPPIEEQQEIVRRVESLFAKADKIEASYQKLKAKLEQLPQALLAKAFRGELVEQLPTDGDARELLEQIRKLKEEGTRKGKGKKLVAEEEVRMVAEDGAKYGKRYFQP